MSTQSITNAAWADLEPMLHFTSRPLPYFLTAILFFLVVYSFQGSKSNVPLLNPRKAFEFTDNRLKKEFDFSAPDMMRNWFAKNPDKPIRFNSDTGKVTVLAPKFANEVRNDERLDLFRFLDRVRITVALVAHVLTQVSRPIMSISLASMVSEKFVKTLTWLTRSFRMTSRNTWAR